MTFLIHFLFNDRYRDIYLNYRFPNNEFFRDRMKAHKARLYNER